MKKLSPVIVLFLFAFVILNGTAVATDYTTAVPLPELGEDTYFGVQGGLYPNGQNVPPAAYLAELDAIGLDLANDEVIACAIGPSIMQNSLNNGGFLTYVANTSGNITVIDGSQGSNQERFENPDYEGWDWCVERLPLGKTAADVNVVIYYNVLTGEQVLGFAEYVDKLLASYEITNAIIAEKFPNVQLVLYSSQHYAGNCGNCKAPEPMAYWSGFAVKQLIERRINGSIGGPHLAWNAYHWIPTLGPEYFSDGLHLSGLGSQVTGQLWDNYWSTVSFLASFYLGIINPTPTAVPTGTPTATSTPSPVPTATPTVPGVTETPTPFPSDTPTALPTSDPTITPTGCGRQGLPCPPTRTPVGG